MNQLIPHFETVSNLSHIQIHLFIYFFHINILFMILFCIDYLLFITKLMFIHYDLTYLHKVLIKYFGI
jgi:hypothetical protein